jgi:hypothetical protein
VELKKRRDSKYHFGSLVFRKREWQHGDMKNSICYSAI